MTISVAVIGGGVTGLAAAYRLLRKRPGLRVTLYEASDRLGGIIRTEQADGFIIEGGPDSFLSAKPQAVALSTELGLNTRFQWPNDANRGSFLLRNGALHPMPEGLTGLIPTQFAPMLRTRLLSPWGKLRMVLDLVKPPMPGDADETLQHFIERRLGREAYRNLIEPLMAGIYSGDGAELSLAATFPQLRTAERLHGGLIKGVLAARREAQLRPVGQQVRRGFVTFPTGMHELPDALRDHIGRDGGTIRLGHRVDRVTRQGDGPFVLMVSGPSGQERIEVAGVVIATPARASASLLGDLAPDAAVAMAQIPQVSTALIALGYREGPGATAPEGFGYLVPRAEGRRVKAMTWLSSKWEGRAPEGHFLVRAFVGRSGEQEILQQPDETLVGIVRNEMRETIGVTAAPVLSRVYRAVNAQPQFTLGHPGRVERIEAAVARVPGLAVAGNMFRGVGIPDSIGTAEQAAWSILDYCRALEPAGPVARVANG